MSQGGGDSVSRKRREGTVSQGEGRGKCHRGRGGESAAGRKEGGDSVADKRGRGQCHRGRGGESAAGRKEGGDSVTDKKGEGTVSKVGKGGVVVVVMPHTLYVRWSSSYITCTRTHACTHTHTSRAHTHTWNIDISVTNLYNLHSAPVQREQVKVDQHTLHTTQISPRTPSAEEMLGLSLCPCPSLQQS